MCLPKVVRGNEGENMHQEFLLTRSNYYSQFFNTAIFFDPFRIYFNSAFESVALDLYYNIQQNFKEKSSSNACFYILMYPDSGLFEKSFGTTSEDIVLAKEGSDYIVGLKNSAQFEKHQDIIRAIREKMAESVNN